MFGWKINKIKKYIAEDSCEFHLVAYHRQWPENDTFSGLRLLTSPFATQKEKKTEIDKGLHPLQEK